MIGAIVALVKWEGRCPQGSEDVAVLYTSDGVVFSSFGAPCMLHATEVQHDMRFERAPDVVLCQWFALCTNTAAVLVDHSVLGQVPSCERCQSVGR